MININSTLIIQLVIFISLMLILNKMLFQPVVALLQARRNKIEGDQGEARALQTEAEEARDRFDEGLAGGRLLAAEEKDRVRDAGLEEAKRLMSQARHAVDEEVPKRKAEIERERRRVEAELRPMQGEIARQIAEKLLGRRLT